MGENCLLANTGDSYYGFIAFGVIALTLSIFVIFWRPKISRTPRFLSVVFTLLVLASAVVASPSVLADGAGDASVCSTLSSTADSTTGVLGASQSINVLTNDTPSQGASFVTSSLRLRLPANPRAGSVLGADSMSMTAPGEGTYTALDTGAIVFTPEPTFVGATRGVGYTIADTAGATTTNTYTPTVTGAPVATCSDPASETRVLNPMVIIVLAGSNDYTIDGWLATSGDNPPLDPTQLDLDPAQAGTQTTLSYPLEGWSVTYSPGTDQMTIYITDWTAFTFASSSRPALFQYSIAPVVGCSQPAPSPVTVNIIG